MATESSIPDAISVRLDKWLWAARFFKTRKIAAEAVSGGKVWVNEQRAKPGKEIKPGAILTICKDNYQWQVRVLAISSQRRSASEAALLYQENPESKAQREQQIFNDREQRLLLNIPYDSQKPNKKERRLIHRFKQQI